MLSSFKHAVIIADMETTSPEPSPDLLIGQSFKVHFAGIPP